MTLDCTKTSLKKGDTGEIVTTAQNMLKDLNYYTGKIDGYYGSITYNAVKQFQKDTKHSRDGWLGAKTCKSLNEVYASKITNSKDKKLTNNQTTNNKDTTPRFELLPKSNIIPSITFFDEMVTLPNAESKNNAQKLKKSTLTDFIDWNMNKDADGLTHEATVTIIYDLEKMGQIRLYQKAQMLIKKDDEVLNEFTLDGYVNGLKLSHSDDLFRLEITLCGYTEFLNTSIDNYNETCKRSEHCKKIISLCRLKSDINLAGLNDDSCTINTAQSTEGEDGDSTTGSTSSAGAGATMTLEEIYQKASTFKYGGIGTGLNPDKAWQAYENGGRTFDCYDCSNFLFYCLKNFAKIPCRIVQGYSPYSGSRTHRVVQIKENGSWHCPKQAWNLTRNLRPFTPEDKYALTTKLSWEG